MKTITKAQIQPESQQDALATFEDELKRIEIERQRCTNHISACQRELTTLKERERQRTEQETTAQNTLDHARTAYNEAQLRSEILTEGTLATAAQANLSALEKQLHAAQDSQLKLLNRTQQEADADSRKAQRLEEAIDRATTTLAHLVERERIAINLRDKAFFEKAESLLHAHLDTIRAMEAQRDIQRSTLTSMDDEIAAFIHQATQELASYPEQQNEFSAQFVYHDKLTRILEQEVTLIDCVLSEGRGVEIDTQVARKANQTWSGLTELLSIDQQYLRPAFSLQGGTELLEERKARIQAILTTHRAWKQGRI